MLPAKRTNTILISVIATIGFLGLALAGLTAWLVMFFLPHSPLMFDMYMEDGNAYCDKKDYPKAIEAFANAIETSPRRSAGYHRRAWAYYKTKSYQKALADYDQVFKYAKLEATRQEAHYFRGMSYRGLHHWTHAIPEFTACIDLKEDGTAPYKYRGDTYIKLKDYVRALPDLNLAIHANPKDTILYAARARALEVLHRYGAALDDISFAVRLEPRNPRFLSLLGRVQYVAGQEDAALHTDKNALKLREDDWVRAHLALCYATREDWLHARPEIARALISAAPDDLVAWEQDVRDALKKKPNSPALQKALAMLNAAHVRGGTPKLTVTKGPR